MASILVSRLARTARPSGMVLARSFSAYFTPSHEYVKVDGETGTFGITAHAAEELGDIVFVDLPDVGTKVTKGQPFGAVESVKAASDVYAPVSGVVTEINDQLGDMPGLVNDSALEDGWFVKIKMDSAATAILEELMDEAGYEAHIKSE
ncbi:hypothetical protein CTAYLR_001816 [Chrysophaeum taylorii]|uniref:Glycine cleavage system H protein n=1 Tax=Chrysophaeum taylorii TaxID=2483200 RepID=A0AAD7UA76_9STRA|nr:hypothetical protein CTAYLR_001816 [Chrysophaeum taylorii]